jgi:hypothetical protein
VFLLERQVSQIDGTTYPVRCMWTRKQEYVIPFEYSRFKSARDFDPTVSMLVMVSFVGG